MIDTFKIVELSNVVQFSYDFSAVVRRKECQRRLPIQLNTLNTNFNVQERGKEVKSWSTLLLLLSLWLFL